MTGSKACGAAVIVIPYLLLLQAAPFFLPVPGYIFSMPLFAAGAVIMKYTLVDKPRSLKNKLNCIVLVPVNPRWASWLTYNRFYADKAYEIHFDPGSKEPHELAGDLREDLEYIEKNMEGLFIWEANIAVPRSIRNIIRRYEKSGRAAWEKGYWRFKMPFLTGLDVNKNKHVRRGAIVIKNSCDVG